MCRERILVFRHLEFSFFFYWHGDHLDLHSFPTRRSSDLFSRRRAKSSPPSIDYFAAALTTPSRRPRAGCFRRAGVTRSEEHTSELQSRQYLVCRLLLEKKKKRPRQRNTITLNHETEPHNG